MEFPLHSQGRFFPNVPVISQLIVCITLLFLEKFRNFCFTMEAVENETLRQRKVVAGSHTGSEHPPSNHQKSDIRATSDESEADGFTDGER